MTRAALLLGACLILGGCHVPLMVAVSIAGTIGDKLIGGTDAVVALIQQKRQPTTTPPAPVAPKAIGWAFNGDRQ